MKNKSFIPLLIGCVCAVAVSAGGFVAVKNLIGNRDNTNNNKALNEGIEVSKLVTLQNGKTIVEVDNKPFTSLGVQIRLDALKNCDKYTMADCESFFAKAAELGVTTVEVPVQWKDVEPTKDNYDFSFMDTLLGFVEKYGLKLELLWFGSNMCGDTHSYSTPEYILCDGKTYPKLDAYRTGEYWNYYGVQWFLDFSNDNLIERESKAITETMNHVYSYDKANGNKHALVAFQVLNEADNFVRWRIKQKNVISPTTGNQLTLEEGWEMLLKAYDAYGKAVKNSNYRVYTRTNLTISTSSDNFYGPTPIFINDNKDANTCPNWARDIFELEGIDAVGDDVYTEKVLDVKGISRMYGSKLPGNFSHVAENAGSYEQTEKIMLAALSEGAGYNIYDLVTPPFFISHSTSPNVNQGIASYDSSTKTFKENPVRFTKVQKLISALKKTGTDVNTFDPGNFVGLNIKVREKQNSPQIMSQEIQTKNVKVNFKTTSGAYGYVIDKGNHLDIYTSDNSTFSFGNMTINKVKEGYYDSSDNFIGTDIPFSNNGFISSGDKVYRVDYSNVQEELISNAWDYIGA